MPNRHSLGSPSLLPQHPIRIAQRYGVSVEFVRQLDGKYQPDEMAPLTEALAISLRRKRAGGWRAADLHMALCCEGVKCEFVKTAELIFVDRVESDEQSEALLPVLEGIRRPPLLGHSTVDMSLRYAHLAPDQRRDAVAKLNERPLR